MKFFLKIIGIFFLILILLIVLLLGYLGFIPGLSAVMGSNRPRDLGVRYTSADLASAQAKLGQRIVAPEADPFKQYSSMPGNPVNTTLTQEEYSAHVERIHPVKDIQIKLDGERFQMSGRVDKARIPQFVRTWGLTDASDKQILDAINEYLPSNPIFYIAGTGGAQNNQLNINLTKAEFGRLPIPTDQAQQLVEAYTETLFKQVPGFSVTDSSIENGRLVFTGSAVKEIPQY